MRLFLAFLLALLLAFPAEARLKTGPIDAGSGHRIKSATVVDTMRTSLAAAYSFRRIAPTYAGSALKLRRATGGTLDVGFAASGDFDTAAAATFCNATTCFIDTWYDQTGLGRHATQPTAATQPAYIADCGNGLPCARATGAQILQTASIGWAAGKTTLSAVGRRTAGTGARCYMLSKGNGQFGPTAQVDSWVMTDFVTEFTVGFVVPENVWHAAIAVFDGAAALMRMDGTEYAAGTVAGSTSGTINVLYNNPGTTCEISEALVWDNYALSATERQGLIQNQRNYWTPSPLDGFTQSAGAYSMRRLKSSYTGPGIKLRRATGGTQDINYLGFSGFTGAPLDTAAANAFCASTTCFIDTWYDQSGFGRQGTNGTPANQPAYIADCGGGQPCVEVTTTTQTLATASTTWTSATLTMSAVGNRLSGVARCYFAGRAAGYFDAPPVSNYWHITDFTAGEIYLPANDNTWHAGIATVSGASSLGRIDNAETTGSVGGGAGAATFMLLSGEGAGAVCREREVIAWDAYSLMPGERAALTTNQYSFWGF
jgi:hypothetical protein